MVGQTYDQNILLRNKNDLSQTNTLDQILDVRFHKMPVLRKTVHPIGIYSDLEWTIRSSYSVLSCAKREGSKTMLTSFGLIQSQFEPKESRTRGERATEKASRHSSSDMHLYGDGISNSYNFGQYE